MPRLVLIRHAKAEPPSPEQPDVDRSLAERGRSDARVACAVLHDLALEAPVVVLVSPAVRTQETYALLRDGLPEHTRMDVDPLYEAAVSTVVAAVEDVLEPAHGGGGAGTVVVIGHNPSMRDVVAHLSGSAVAHLPTSAIAVLDGPSAEFASGAWHLDSLTVPRAQA